MFISMKTIVTILMVFLFREQMLFAESPEPLIIDTDTTAFHLLTLDMEDDLAVLFAMASPELDVKALTITYGNGMRSQTYADALRLKQLAGWTIPVLPGADYFDKNLQHPTEASEFIAKTALNAPDGITLLALGAMTNIATALVTHPEIVPKIRRIVMMGGYISRPNIEVNFTVDARASNIIFSSAIPKVIIPTETCLQTVFTDKQLRQILDHPESVVYQFHHRIRTYLHIWRWAHNFFYPYKHYPFKVTGGFIPWDSITTAFLVRPELFSQFLCFDVSMINGRFSAQKRECTSDQRGRALIPLSLNREGFDQLFMERILDVSVQ